MRPPADQNERVLRAFELNAALYESRYMDVTDYASVLDRFLAPLPHRAEVLELACGPGNITRYLVDRRPDLQVLATDLAPTMLEHARRNVPEAEFRELDCRRIAQLGRTFHGIVCGFCLPYLSPEETEQLIHECADLLHPGGMFYLSALEGELSSAREIAPSSGKGEPVFVQFYPEEVLATYLSAAGFGTVHVERAGEGLVMIGRKD
ncbi:MAG TPA: class I SAM-dependent methyltransferase [Flavobacteriales bacterium]